MRARTSRSALLGLSGLVGAVAIAACSGDGGGGGGGSPGLIYLAIGSTDLVTDESGMAQTTVFVARDGYNGPIDITLAAGAPADVTMDPLTIAAGASSGELVLHTGPSTPPGGPTPFAIVGEGKNGEFDDLLITLLVTGASGTLDETFGAGGLATVAFAGPASAEDALELSDGSIVLGGWANGDFALAKLDADGVPVASFGSAGTATVDIAGGEDKAYALLRQNDGKLVLAGTAATNGGLTMALARFTEDGELDTSFGNGGVVTTPGAGADGVLYEVERQAGGKLLGGGTAMVGTTFTMTLVRYESSGALDSTFGDGDGIAHTSLGDSHSGAYDVDALAELNVVSGYMMTEGERLWTVALFSLTGELLGEFAAGGLDGGTAYFVDTGLENLLVAGTQGVGTDEAFIARLAFTGNPDPAFGGGDGVVTFPGTAVNMAQQNDGRLVIGGESGGDFLVCRATLSGEVDPSWGTAGVTTADFGAADEAVREVLVSRDTRVIPLGVSGGKMAIARFWP